MCLFPIQLKKETWKQKLSNSYHMQEAPCGRCVECMRARVDSWHMRLNEELKICDTAYFCTLTYSDDTLNFSPSGLVSLNYKDHQNFMKYLRKLHDGKPIKYFAVGEYGEKTHRPHFHSLIFNAALSDIEKAWTKGGIHVGEVNDASIRYTLKYAMKRSHKLKKKVDPDDDRLLEKALMSQGIGISYLTPTTIKYHKDHLQNGCRVNGSDVPLPRYYRDKMFTDSEKLARNKLVCGEEQNAERFEKISSNIFPQRVEKMYSDLEKKIQKYD